jgi:hypothetical protein
MDEDVLAAMKRWPDVPAVRGWLSLDPRGNWRLHPQGDAADGGLGEPISNPRILDFFARNYTVEADGRWFVQNGPQRVYVRIDVAPLVLRTGEDSSTLIAHTGQPVSRIDAWYLDDTGRLLAATNLGPGVIIDRDLSKVLDGLLNEKGELAAAPLADGETPQKLRYAPLTESLAPFYEVSPEDLPERLGFVAIP